MWPNEDENRTHGISGMQLTYSQMDIRSTEREFSQRRKAANHHGEARLSLEKKTKPQKEERKQWKQQTSMVFEMEKLSRKSMKLGVGDLGR